MIQHKHLIIRAEIDEPPEESHMASIFLNDSINHLIHMLGMKVVLPARSIFIKEKGNEGYTGQAGLETSHIAYHIWNKPNRKIMNTPSKGLIQFDLYTCGDLNDKQVRLCQDWVNTFVWSYMDLHVFDRSIGLQEITKNDK